ncbi:hypothetical protein niasHT_021362 [Heterodera trifolii]|uniref:Uncharacterized protein n=1 Tax=Heterodera trifolii TaxID=157864 RepID=A0ABD2K6N8_9BILA
MNAFAWPTVHSLIRSFVPPPVQRKNAVPPIPTPPNAFHFIHFNSQLKGVFVADGRTILGLKFWGIFGAKCPGALFGGAEEEMCGDVPIHLLKL